jgi:release factor glutamine methyltransferase
MACTRIDLYCRFEQVPEEAVLGGFRELVRRAVKHAPIAYLVGRKEFFSLSFEVNGDVLIPRPETETLVERAIHVCNGCGGRSVEVLDVGTGSGCIIIALLTQSPNSRGTAADISTAALAVARRNAECHRVSERVRFLEADCLKLPAEAVPDGGFHLIVSNPPYVARDEMATLDQTVRDYEPSIALTDGGDGLSFFKSLAGDGPMMLRDGGAILVEIGAGQYESVRSIFLRGGRFEHAGTYRTPGQSHERVMHLVKV